MNKFWISCDIWIDCYANDSYQFEILMKLFLPVEYDIELRDWDIDCSNAIVDIYDNISRNIHL